MTALSSPALAQSGGVGQAPHADGGLMDIVVTARKAEENLQNVPVAITAFSGRGLETQNALKVEDIARLTPGFNATVTKSAASSLYLTLRGQVQNDSLATVDPSVGVYVDDMYWARSYGVSMDLLDVSNVQVLKGPQGTLFGRNTTGGALLLNSNDPDFSDFGGMVQGTYGRFNERSGTAVVNIPVIPDKVAIRGAIKKYDRDGLLTDAGFFNNIGGRKGTKFDDRDSLTWRVKAAFRPVEDLEVILSAESYRDHGNQYAQRLTYLYPGGALEGDLKKLGMTTADIDAYLRLNREDPDFISVNDVSNNSVRTRTYNGRVILDTSFGAIKFITGHRHTVSHNALDLDGSVGSRHFTDQNQDLEQTSAEFQVTGKAADDTIDFATGVSYLRESGWDRAFSGVTFGVGPATTLLGIIETDAWGIYGQSTWHVTDALSLTGGLRYSVDDKRIKINNRRATYAQAFDNNLFAGGVTCLYPTVGAAPTDALGNCVYQRGDSFDGISYTAGVDYKPTESVLLYIKTSKGFRSGGENLRAIITPVSFTPFRPEVSYQHEVGFKSQFLDNRARFNAAAYYTKIKDYQASVIVGSPGQLATIVQNAASVTIWGLEADLTVEVATGLTATLNGAIVRPKFDRYLDFATGADLSQSYFSSVSKSQFSISGDYSRQFGSVGLKANANYSWTGFTALDDDFSPAAILPYTTRKSSGVLNARVAVQFADDRYEIALFGRNILDNRDLVSALAVPSFGYVNGRFRDPATYGVSATVRFGGGQ